MIKKTLIFAVLFFSTLVQSQHIDSTKTATYFISKGNKNLKKQNFEQSIKNYLEALKILENEKDSIQLIKVYTNIGVLNARLKNFDKAISAIISCQSKIIFCGVGKSGLIASKIASTMSSVGCPAFSLSANDCLHGDLGSISSKDLLILISNSGKSKELLPIIKFANRNKIKLIGIVSEKNSSLYKGSDIQILLPEVKEAGLGIVPTSSTSVQLAVGDALAVSALNKKKFSKYDFSKLHPGGNLGKQLKTVEELMVTKNKIPFINENKNLKNAIKTITSKKLGVLIAKNSKGLTKGILTDGNVRKLRLKNHDLNKTLVI